MNMIEYIETGFDTFEFEIDLLGFFDYWEIIPQRRCYKIAIDMLLTGEYPLI